MFYNAENLKNQSEKEIWDVFYSLGTGSKVFLVQFSGPLQLWVFAPVTNPCLTDFRDVESVTPLLAKGIVKKVEITHPVDNFFKAEYQLTGKGEEIFTRIQTQMRQAGFQAFRSEFGFGTNDLAEAQRK